jgi:hypothetical protein
MRNPGIDSLVSSVPANVVVTTVSAKSRLWRSHSLAVGRAAVLTL